MTTLNKFSNLLNLLILKVGEQVCLSYLETIRWEGLNGSLDAGMGFERLTGGLLNFVKCLLLKLTNTKNQPTMKTNRPFNNSAVGREVQARQIKDREQSRPIIADNTTRNVALFFALAFIGGIVLYALGYIDKF